MPVKSNVRSPTRRVSRTPTSGATKRYPSGLVFLYSPSSQGMVASSRLGPPPTYSYAGNQYNDQGVSIGAVPAWHEGKGVDLCPARTYMLQNSKFEGAVSGTPGTAPTNWTAVLSAGTLTANVDGSIITAVTETNRHFLGQSFTAAINTTYYGTANIVGGSALAIQEIFTYSAIPAGATISHEIDGVSVISSAQIPAGTHKCTAKLVVVGTAGTPQLRIGAKCLSVIDSAVSITFSKPQLTANYLYPYVATGANQTISVVSAAATSGGNGMSFALTAGMLAALGTGGRFTAAALCYMGVGSGELPLNDTVYYNHLSVRDNINSISYMMRTAGDSAREIISYDGTTGPFLVSTWSRDEIHLKIVQTNSTGTQFRVGNRRYSSTMAPIDANIVWGAWVAYDGSMNPLTHLRLAYNGTVPLWISQVQLWNKSAADAKILDLLRYVS